MNKVVVGARCGDVVAQYDNRSTVLSVWSEGGTRTTARVFVDGALLMHVLVPRDGYCQFGPMDCQVKKLGIQVVGEESEPEPIEWSTVGDVLDELGQYDRDKPFRIRDCPRYCDELEDNIDINRDALSFRDAEDAVIWDVWELL